MRVFHLYVWEIFSIVCERFSYMCESILLIHVRVCVWEVILNIIPDSPSYMEVSSIRQICSKQVLFTLHPLKPELLKYYYQQLWKLLVAPVHWWHLSHLYHRTCRLPKQTHNVRRGILCTTQPTNSNWQNNWPSIIAATKHLCAKNQKSDQNYVVRCGIISVSCTPLAFCYNVQLNNRKWYKLTGSLHTVHYLLLCKLN